MIESIHMHMTIYMMISKLDIIFFLYVLTHTYESTYTHEYIYIYIYIYTCIHTNTYK